MLTGGFGHWQISVAVAVLPFQAKFVCALDPKTFVAACFGGTTFAPNVVFCDMPFIIRHEPSSLAGAVAVAVAPAFTQRRRSSNVDKRD